MHEHRQTGLAPAFFLVKGYWVDQLYEISYNCIMKFLEFVGTALKDLRDFPESVRRTAGFQLRQVQSGLDPDDWKPMSSIGPGVREIRIHESGEFRVLYIARFAEAIYVLHAFQKKTRKTPQRDLALARARLKQIRGERP